jgi:hypothetical protein
MSASPIPVDYTSPSCITKGGMSWSLFPSMNKSPNMCIWDDTLSGVGQYSPPVSRPLFPTQHSPQSATQHGTRSTVQRVIQPRSSASLSPEPPSSAPLSPEPPYYYSPDADYYSETNSPSFEAMIDDLSSGTLEDKPLDIVGRCNYAAITHRPSKYRVEKFCDHVNCSLDRIAEINRNIVFALESFNSNLIRDEHHMFVLILASQFVSYQRRGKAFSTDEDPLRCIPEACKLIRNDNGERDMFITELRADLFRCIYVITSEFKFQKVKDTRPVFSFIDELYVKFSEAFVDDNFSGRNGFVSGFARPLCFSLFLCGRPEVKRFLSRSENI